ncbi:RagB/SusD family nutrient uptake outer membrane protein [uncultured Draconibacterium sp.]|uniref:RagB/SusD family nutrient uptake outer membrane protein n=1 Tax=uncultured Draconibacterium sp. TaxID=1573823 RepID=UPI002AA8B1F5|nr:RagB/SusD family nutrient uptake outer membrane protein [uncultured Draconibacterium sp.]
MRKILYISLACVLLLTACQDTYLDLDPQDSITEAAYYKTPEHFKSASNDLYFNLTGWRTLWGGVEYFDFGSDLNGLTQDYGRGHDEIPQSDDFWTNNYKYLRKVNMVLQKAEEYEGDASEIEEYVATAYFFRAFHHFFLMQRFGGVPIVTEVLDVNSESLTSPRNSRYEVFAQILADLDMAIGNLPTESEIAEADKGKISKYAAMAFKAKALLFEGTWEMNVGNSTDGDGVSAGAGSNKPSGYMSTSEMISEANSLAKNVMDNGGYSLWNHNEELDNLSNLYLFNLEDAGSNPAGLEKASNNEFILYQKFDYNLYQSRKIVSHVFGGRGAPSRKFMDMFLCADGKTIYDSELFEGYETCASEFQNRDYRMTSYFADHETWDTWTPGTLELLLGSVGWSNRKFYTYQYGSYRAQNEESYDYPIIRLAEVYLIYAETLYLMNGSLTDAQMAESINLIKARAGLPGITNAILADNGMDIWEEIKRERAVELYLENSRYFDLKRWAEAEEALSDDICGPIVEGNEYEGNPDLYNPEAYPYGTKKITTPMGDLDAVIVDPSTVRNFQRMHYLFPIPIDQLDLNENLLQNPGY